MAKLLRHHGDTVIISRHPLRCCACSALLTRQVHGNTHTYKQHLAQPHTLPSQVLRALATDRVGASTGKGSHFARYVLKAAEAQVITVPEFTSCAVPILRLVTISSLQYYKPNHHSQ